MIFFLIQLKFSNLNFKETSKIESDECPPNWGRFVLGGRTDLMKPIFVFSNLAIAPKRCIQKTSHTTSIQRDSLRS